MWKNTQFFLLVLLLALLVQGTLWRVTTFTDESLWAKRVVRLSQDLRSGTRDFDQEKYSEHPGMPVLLLAVGADRIGVNEAGALKGAVALINSCIIAGLVTLAKTLRPKSIWWLGAGGLILFHPLYYQASPTDAVMAPLAVIIMFLILWFFERQSQITAQMLLVFSLCIGAALATRLHFTALLIIPLLFFLVMFAGIKKSLLVLVGTAAIAWLLNPLMWFTPAKFLKAALFDQIGFYTGSALEASIATAVTLEEFVLFAPLAIISLLLSVLFLFTPNFKPAVSNSFVIVMLISTAVPALIIFESSLQSLRYFFPLIFIWEAFLPLWLLQGVKQIKLSFVGLHEQRRWQKTARVGVVSMLALGQIFLLLYVYYLPAREYLVDWQRISLQISHK